MLKITHGTMRGRAIIMPDQRVTRPTSNMVREAILNILIHRFRINFSKITVWDVFAGSGALGIESISLGSQKVVFTDIDKNAIMCIRSNLKKLNITQQSHVFHMDVLKLSKRLINENHNFDVIFLDPPYKNIQDIAKFVELITSKGILTIETDVSDFYCDNIEIMHKCSYGKTFIYFARSK